MPKLVQTWKLSPVEAGSMASYGFVGLMFGAGLMGMLSDRIGRKKTLMIAITWFSVLSGATYFAPNFQVFVVMRFWHALAWGGLCQ